MYLSYFTHLPHVYLVTENVLMKVNMSYMLYFICKYLFYLFFMWMYIGFGHKWLWITVQYRHKMNRLATHFLFCECIYLYACHICRDCISKDWCCHMKSMIYVWDQISSDQKEIKCLIHATPACLLLSYLLHFVLDASSNYNTGCKNLQHIIVTLMLRS